MPIGKLAAAEHCHRVAQEGKNVPMAGEKENDRDKARLKLILGVKRFDICISVLIFEFMNDT